MSKKSLLLLSLSLWLAAGCEEPIEISAATSALAGAGRHLFEDETFGGNGRTCATCHIGELGSLSPAQVQETFARNPRHPLFRSLDSDDGVGESYSLLMRDATIRVTLPLPPNVRILEHPEWRSITVRRGVPTMVNMGLQEVLMYDGREPDLERQARSAVSSHFEPTVLPTRKQMEEIAAFQRTLFTDGELAAFAAGGPPKELPPGNTGSEKRGRKFFENGERGLCAICHSGPMLDTTNEFNPVDPIGVKISGQFSSEFNALGNPAYTWVVTMPDGTVRISFMPMPDPGVVLTNGNPCEDPGLCDLDGFFLSGFKIPTLWGSSKTAPYFHDGSARTPEEMVDHYIRFFDLAVVVLGDPRFITTKQERDDILAYFRLL